MVFEREVGSKITSKRSELDLNVVGVENKDVMRRDQEYVGRRMIEMELSGKRKRRRPKRRFLDVVKENMGSWCEGDGR